VTAGEQGNSWRQEGDHFLYAPPDESTWLRLRQQLHVGQRITGTVVWVPRPGAIGIGVDLGLAAGGFVDVLHLPLDTDRWPALGTVSEFEIRWLDERPQIRLTPVDPAFRRRVRAHRSERTAQ
jgi:hypothetical protein